MKLFLLTGALFFANIFGPTPESGPDSPGGENNPKPIVLIAGLESRFVLQKLETVRDSDAYDGRRSIYILHDCQTGKDYVGVSGIGITEMGSHPSGKSTITDER